MIKRLFLPFLLAALSSLALATALSVAPAAQAQEKPALKDVSQETVNVELIDAMKKRQEELDRREKELKSREGRVDSLERDLDKKIDELKRMQLKLEELIKLRDDVEKKNVSALSKTYSAMQPAVAADRIKAMDRAIALKILGAMKSKQAAKVLSSLDAKTATEMTEQLAKRRLKK
ncbi:MAG: MotE family protein [Nitrospinota bacterium]